MINLINKNSKLFLYILIFTLFSGSLRKWVFDSKQAGNLIFGLQLILPLIILVKNSFQISRIFNNQYIVIYLLYLFISAINPLNLTIYHGLIGVILHIGFWLLLFYYLSNRELFQLDSIIKIIFILIIAELILATIQYTLPNDNILNKYVDVEKVGSVALVGTSVRVTGTFSYISGFNSFLVFATLFIWVLVKKYYPPFQIVSMACFIFYGCLISGSRGSVYLFVIFISALVYQQWNYLSKFLGSLILPVIFFLTLAAGSGSLGFQTNLNKVADNFSERRQRGRESGEEETRIFGEFLAVYNFKGNYPVLGIGIGSTYQGAQAFFGTSEFVKEYGFVEGEIERVVLEGGFILLLFRVLLAFVLVRALIIPLSLKFILFLCLIYFVPVAFNVYNSMFLALGIILVDNIFFWEGKKSFYAKKNV